VWSLLKRNDKECRRLRDALERAAATCGASVSVKNLTGELTPEEQKHLSVCDDCQEAVRDLVATKELFRGAASFAEDERPWLAARVMAAIASRERDLAQRVSAWTEFPRFASRLALVTAIVLLAGTTWFYESVQRSPSYPSTGSQESIFEAPQQSSPDDILISMADDIHE
jgi:hypothetical protein